MLCKIENKLGLNLANYTDENLEKAQHPFEIEKAEHVIIHLDYLHSGLGSNSCGEEQLEENKSEASGLCNGFYTSASKLWNRDRRSKKTVYRLNCKKGKVIHE